MSKVDAMRALREARWSTARSTPAAVPAASGPPVPRSPRPTAAPAGAQAGRASRRSADGDATPAAAPALCGHRNMAGRSCTREPDHVQHGTKNHRYG